MSSEMKKTTFHDSWLAKCAFPFNYLETEKKFCVE